MREAVRSDDKELDMRVVARWLTGCLVVGALAFAPAKASASGIGFYDADSLSSDPFVLGGTNPGKWGSPVFGTGATVSWSLMPGGASCAAEFAGCTISALSSFMPAGFHAAIQAAFD